jgi:hypothetical protein
MSDMSTAADDMQFEAAAGGGIIEPEVELSGWEIPLIRAEVAHLRHDTDRLAGALEGVFPPRAGLHDVPQQIRVQIDALAAWLDDVDDPTHFH